MHQIRILLLSLALMGYFAGAMGHIYYFVAHRVRIFWMATGFVGIGFLAQTAALATRFADLGTLPVTQFFDFLMVFSWAGALAYGVAQIRFRMPHLGLFVVPVVLLVLVAALLQPKGRGAALPSIDNVWLTIHIVMAFLGAATFVVLFSMALMYMIQEYQVKQKRFGAWFYRLPSLEVLDGGSFWALAVGFPMMTLGLLSGLVWALLVRGPQMHLSLQRTLPLLVIWAAYGVLLVCRMTVGWRGRRAALFSVLGFIGVVISYLLHL